MLMIFLASCLPCDLYCYHFFVLFYSLLMFYCPLLYPPQTEPFLAVLYKCNLDLSLSHEIAGSF